jgi:hypothetical protein
MEVSRSPSGGRYQRLNGSQRRSRHGVDVTELSDSTSDSGDGSDSSDFGSDSDSDASGSGDGSDSAGR